MLCRPGRELVGQEIEMKPRFSWPLGQETMRCQVKYWAISRSDGVRHSEKHDWGRAQCVICHFGAAERQRPKARHKCQCVSKNRRIRLVNDGFPKRAVLSVVMEEVTIS